MAKVNSRPSSRGSRKGATEARLFTPPLRKLSKRNSLGPTVVDFAAEVLGIELLPWQRWTLLHALELDQNGDFRFRTIVILVARQSGKTTLLKVLIASLMLLGKIRLALGTAQSLDIARESWAGCVDLIEGDRELKEEIAVIRRVNGDQELKLVNGSRYRIAASSRSAGRGLSVDLLVMDELREHRTWEAWSAASKTTMARPNALTFCISNAGDDESVVLNMLRERALSGEDESLGIFEYSAPEDCALDDWDAIAQANPGLGYTISEQAIVSARATDPPAVFRTEVLCQRVETMNSAFDMSAWRACHDPAGTMDGLRDRMAFVLDVAPDGQHVTLVAAAPQGGSVRAEVVAAFADTEEARKELPGLIQRANPPIRGYFSAGPASALTPMLKDLDFLEIKGTQVVAACMGLVDLVRARQLLHPGDPLLDAHVAGTAKLPSGDGFRFSRQGAGHCDASYALAGAVHLALTEEPPEHMPLPMIVF